MALRKRKQERECEGMQSKKKRESEWRPEDCAKPIGDSIKSTGEGEKKKCHYNKFEFHNQQYGLEDSIIVVPEHEEQNPYVAIIKDIFIQGKKKHVKLEVQWFYRQGDIEKKHVGNWECKEPRNIFYSFHCDEVCAESVIRKCRVHFVPENKQIPDRREHPGFIVQNVYDFFNKKLRKLSYKGFNAKQKKEIDQRIASTISRVGHLLDIVKEQKTLIRSAPKWCIKKSNEVSQKRSASVNPSGSRINHSDCDKSVEEILEEIKHKFITTDATNYCNKLKILADKHQNSGRLVKRLQDGDLKPEQVIKMTCYELERGFTFDEMKANIDKLVYGDASSSTSKNIGRKHS